MTGDNDDSTDHPAGGPTPETVIEVARSGGFAGLTRHAKFQLDELPPDSAHTWSELLQPGVLAEYSSGAGGSETSAARASSPMPDRFTYRVRCAAVGLDVTLGERNAPEWLRSAIDTRLQAEG